MHGQTIAIPGDWDHFHVAGMAPLPAEFYGSAEPTETIPESSIRKGTYSSVSGRRGDFEWDGWVSH